MTLTSPEFLTNLPSIVFMWTCFSLCWGAYAYMLYNKMISYREKRGWFLRAKVDRCNSKFILLANVCLFAYLLVDPFIHQYTGESFIIINVFYNAYLFAASSRLYSWWKKRMISKQPQSSPVDHLWI